MWIKDKEGNRQQENGLVREKERGGRVRSGAEVKGEAEAEVEGEAEGEVKAYVKA